MRILLNGYSQATDKRLIQSKKSWIVTSQITTEGETRWVTFMQSGQ